MRFSQDLAVKATSAAIGAALAFLLADLLAPKVALILPQAPHATRVSVRVARAARPAPAPALAPVASTDKELRLNVDKPVPVQKPKPKPIARPRVEPQEKLQPARVPPSVAQPAITQPPVANPALPSNALPTLSQPALGSPVASAVANVPRIGADTPELPPEAPPEGQTTDAAATAASDGLPASYPEKVGGPVLVLGLLLNDQGRVLDTKILVPSFNPLTDIAVSMASIGKTWTNVQPPLNPGESRWVELRIPFQDPDKPQSNLP